MGFLFFKTKAEREMEARIAVKQTMNELKKCLRTIEKRRKELLEAARTAKEKGLTQQYRTAVSGLKMLMSYDKRCNGMLLQIQMTETMRDLALMNTKFVKLMGSVGKEVSKVTKSANFAKNQLDFEKGMLAAEAAMDQLEGFMEQSGMAFESATEEDMDAEVEAMLDASIAAGSDPLDEDIEERLRQSEAKRAKLSE